MERMKQGIIEKTKKKRCMTKRGQISPNSTSPVGTGTRDVLRHQSSEAKL